MTPPTPYGIPSIDTINPFDPTSLHIFFDFFSFQTLYGSIFLSLILCIDSLSLVRVWRCPTDGHLCVSRRRAKALVGVFSDYAVDEAREKFWKSIESGQSFGKRMTFWDAIFSIGSSRRDDSAGAFIMRWVRPLACEALRCCATAFSHPHTLTPSLPHSAVSSRSIAR